ncbi:MAG: winged helix-turn-helix domain-containing protein, partial [Gammaproteobacteria bacterium]|nr:winged helix-turn-helix domain-containing protein [Gammaproteobacteria bacterium]MBU1554106.1 winged helix-turn-helix domain-containing protein [Gammaproteobacteria bacterium]
MEFSALSPVTAGSAENSWSNGFSLNEFAVFPASGEVKTAQGVQNLEPKVMQVLLQLVNCAGEVISAEQLFSLVWPRSVYSPVSVRRAVNQLRKVFADDNKTIFKTYPKRGYALHARLSPLTPEPGAAPADKAQAIETSIASSQPAFHSGPTFYRQPVGHSTLLPPQRFQFPRKRIGFLVLLMLAFCAVLLLDMTPGQTPVPTWQLTSLQPLTSTAAQESYSVFTPDSQAVVYVKQAVDAQHRQDSELWLTSLDRAQNQLLYRSNSRIDFFTWLPASTGQPANLKLLLASQQADTVRFVSLTLSDDYQLQTSIELFALPDTEVVSPFFSVGTTVFFLAQQQGKQQLYQANLASGQVDLLLSPNHQFSPYRIAASADEDTITV